MFKKYFDFFENYVLNLPLEDSLKNVILNKDFINRNPEFYIYYPLFFAESTADQKSSSTLWAATAPSGSL